MKSHQLGTNHVVKDDHDVRHRVAIGVDQIVVGALV